MDYQLQHNIRASPADLIMQAGGLRVQQCRQGHGSHRKPSVERMDYGPPAGAQAMHLSMDRRGTIASAHPSLVNRVPARLPNCREGSLLVKWEWRSSRAGAQLGDSNIM